MTEKERPTLAAALAAAQAEFDAVEKSRVAKIKPGFSYSYATLADVFDAVRATLAKYAIAVVQTVGPAPWDGGPIGLLTTLLHGPSGETLVGWYPIAASLDASAQTFGSATAYARRYGLCAMLAVAPVDVEDDGAKAEAAPPRGDLIAPGPRERREPPLAPARESREPRPTPVPAPPGPGGNFSNRLKVAAAQHARKYDAMARDVLADLSLDDAALRLVDSEEKYDEVRRMIDAWEPPVSGDSGEGA